MPVPQIDDENKKKPLCYDPSRKKFIYYDEIITRKEQVVSPSALSKEDQKKLVLERQAAGPDYKTQSISGPLMTRDDVVKAIMNDEKYGRIAVEAEISYLDDLLGQIIENLP